MEKRIAANDAAEPRRKTASDRKQEGLREILRKSSRLMADVGFHGTSMRTLSRATDRSLSGLYHYFTSKEDLLFLINYHGFTTINETWQRMAGSFETPQARLYGFIYVHTHYYVANMDEMRVMMWGTQPLERERAMVIEKLKDQHTTDARNIVKELHEAATGRSIGHQRLSRLTYLLFGMMNWIFGWYSSRSHGSVDELIRDIFRTFMNGVGDNNADDELLEIESVVRESFRLHRASSLWESVDAELPEVG